MALYLLLSYAVGFCAHVLSNCIILGIKVLDILVKGQYDSVCFIHWVSPGTVVGKWKTFYKYFV